MLTYVLCVPKAAVAAVVNKIMNYATPLACYDLD